MHGTYRTVGRYLWYRTGTYLLLITNVIRNFVTCSKKCRCTIPTGNNVILIRAGTFIPVGFTQLLHFCLYRYNEVHRYIQYLPTGTYLPIIQYKKLITTVTFIFAVISENVVHNVCTLMITLSLACWHPGPI